MLGGDGALVAEADGGDDVVVAVTNAAVVAVGGVGVVVCPVAEVVPLDAAGAVGVRDEVPFRPVSNDLAWAGVGDSVACSEGNRLKVASLGGFGEVAGLS
jgi:hypothetical protein